MITKTQIAAFDMACTWLFRNDIDTIAERFEHEGIKGKKSNLQHCPIANWVRAQLPNDDIIITVNRYEISMFPRPDQYPVIRAYFNKGGAYHFMSMFDETDNLDDFVEVGENGEAPKA